MVASAGPMSACIDIFECTECSLFRHQITEQSLHYNGQGKLLEWQEGVCTYLKDNLPHNTCHIYVKPHSKNTQMTLESQIFDEKALS